MISESLPTDDGRIARPAHTLRQRSAFRVEPDERAPLPDFSTVRDLLPEPVLPDRPHWVQQYWTNWAAVWAVISYPADPSTLTGPVLLEPSGGSILMGDSALVARLAGYAARGFDLIHLLDNFYSAQLDNGFIPREIEIRSGDACVVPFEPNSTGPNLLAWTEWRHYRLLGDESRLRAVFPSLVTYHRWLRLNRTWQSGLYWSTGTASGVVGQTCVPQGDFHHRHWAWLNATLQANVSGLLLGRMAELVDQPAIAEEMSAERSTLGRQINADMWNEATAFYHHTAPDGAFSSARTMAAYWALLDKQLVPEDRRKLLIQALRDEQADRRHANNGTRPAGIEPEAIPEQPDLEPIVATPLTAYVAMRGLQTAGAWQLAHTMAVDSLEGHGAESRNGHAESTATPEAATLANLMILEQVIGLAIDWPLRQVTWRNYLGHEAETGVRRITLGDEGTADLLAADGVLTIRTAAPFTLSYRDQVQEFQSAIPAGVSTFDLR